MNIVIKEVNNSNMKLLTHLAISTFLVLIRLIGNTQDLTQTIKGRIIDEQSRSPLIGATVKVQDISPIMGSITDVDGYFKIENVPIGRHTLEISSVGYERKTIPELLVGSGKEVVLDIQLIEALVEMDEIVIIANQSDKGQPLNELATVSAISLSVEETSRYAATFEDPARAALTYAGVSTGGDDLLNEIVIRGNSPKGLLWRLEGVEIPNPNHFANIGSSAGGVSMLSSSVLSNSDFFTGAFPAQYGNATSGIFDLNLRKGNFEKHEHGFQAGILGVAASSEGPISRDNRSSYVANYRYSTLALFDNLGIEILGSQEDVAFQDLSFKVHIPTNRAGSFSIWGLGGYNQYSYKPDPEIGDWWHEENDHYMGVGGITHIAYFGENTFLESIVSGSGYVINNLIDSLYLQIEEKEDFHETAVRFSSYLNHKFNARNTLRIGGIASRIGYNLESREWIEEEQSLETYLDEKGNTNLYQGFANWQFRKSEKLTINTGLHLTHFTLNKDLYLEPRLGFRWRVTPTTSVTGGAGLHSRMETLALYMARQEEDNGSITRNNKDLGFTKAAHGVIGFEKMLQNDLRFKTEIYYQHLYDVPIWNNDTTSDAYLQSFSVLNTYDGYTSEKLDNGGTGENYGVEFTLEKFFTNNYYFLTTASLYESKYKGVDEVERDTRFNGNYIFNVVGGKEFKMGTNNQNLLSVNGRVILSGGKRQAPILVEESRDAGFTVNDFNRNYELQLDQYWRFDIGVSYRINKPNHASLISLNIQNVTGRANEYGRWFSDSANRIVADTQIGMFPNLSYRIEF